MLFIAIFVLLCNIGGGVSARDAAIEVEEGNVSNWIKYYNRERGMEISDPAISEDSERDDSGIKSEFESTVGEDAE